MDLFRLFNFGRFFAFSVCALMALPVFAGPSVTFQGRILNPQGGALEEAGVQIRITVLSPDSHQCILFDETHTVDLTNSGGLFTVALNDGTGSRNDLNAWNFATALSNANPFTVSAVSCVTGTTYTPSLLDERKVAVYFQRLGMSGWEEMTEPTNRPALTHAPFALETRAINGFGANNLCRVADGGVPQTITPMTSANYSELLNLVGGTSTKYMARSSNGGAALPSYSGAPGTSSSGDMWYDSSTNQIKYNNGTGTPQTLGTSGAGITNLTIGTGLTPTGTISAGGTTIAVNVGTGANQIVQMTAGAKLPAVDGSNLTGLTGAQITGAVQNGGQTGAVTLGPSDANSLTLNTTGLPRMTILAGGNVGIGTAAPTATLDVPLNTTATNTAQFGTFGIQSFALNNGAFQDNTYWNGSNYIYRNTGTVEMVQFLGGGIAFRTAASGTAGTVATVATVMNISNAGNVNAAGSLTASTLLASSTSTTGAALNLNNTGTSGHNWVFSSDGSANAAGVGALEIYDSTMGLTRQTFLPNGNVGIGTAVPAAKLDVVGTVNATGFTLNGSAFTPATTSSAVAAAGGSAGSITQSSTDVATATRTALTLQNAGTGGANEYLLLGKNAAGTTTFSVNQAGAASLAGGLTSGGVVTSNSLVTPLLSGSTANSGTLTLDSTTGSTKGNIFIAPTGGNVGIGTSSPGAKLDVSTATTTGIQLATGSASTDPTIKMYAPLAITWNRFVTTGPFALFTSVANDAASTPNLFVATAGNVGIGTSAPAGPLHVESDAVGTASAAHVYAKPALTLMNATPAAVSAPQAVGLRMTGQAWNATSSTSQTADWLITGDPTGQTNPNPAFIISTRLNGGSWNQILNIDSSGQFQSPFQFAAYNAGSTLVRGVRLSNDMAATAAIPQQNSPYFHMYGSGWETSTAASQVMSIGQVLTPQQGVTNPIGIWKMFYGTNTTTPVEANELVRYLWGDSLGVVFNKNNIAGYTSVFNGNVGIGTVTPTSALDVRGPIFLKQNADDWALRMSRTDDSQIAGIKYTGHVAATGLDFYTNNTARMRIDVGGYVGMGISSPKLPLHVAVQTAFSPGLNVQYLTGTETALSPPPLIKPPLITAMGGDSSNNVAAVIGIIQPGLGTVGVSPTLNFASTRSTTAQLNAGTYTPLQPGDGLGSILFAGDNGVNLRSAAAGINAYAGTTWSNTNNESFLTFTTTATGTTAATERMRVMANGNVGIGTAAAAAPLHVYTTNTSGNIASFTSSSGVGCSIAYNGSACSSDARLKENVETSDGSAMLNNLLKVRSVHFTWIQDPNHEKQTGFIAQELRQLFPEFIKTDANGFLQVNYANFTSVLTSAVQELHSKVRRELASVNDRVADNSAQIEILRASKDKEIKELKEQTQELKAQMQKQAHELEAIKQKLSL